MPETVIDLFGLKIGLTRIGRGPPLLLLTARRRFEIGSSCLDRLSDDYKLVPSIGSRHGR